MKLKLMLATAAVMAVTAGAAYAADDFQPAAKGAILLNVRVSEALPVANNQITTNTGAATGLRVRASDSVTPTIGLSYFVTDHVSLEVIAGVTDHQIKAVGPKTNVVVANTWLLPPTVTAQYHVLPKSRLNPYLGLGAGYMEFFSGVNKNGFTVGLSDGFAPSLNAGVDYALSGKWSVNLDVKKIYFKTDANINNGALGSKVYLDPVVASVGVGYKF